MFREKEFIRVCKLEDGREMEYDACDKNYNLISYPADKWEYLGRGKVISINGIKQSFRTIDHFWRRK